MRRRSTWGIVFAGLLVLGCGSDEPDPAPPHAFQKFDDAVDAYLADNDLAGATAVIVTEDEGIVHARGYGAFGEDRISLIASASKIVSVGVLMRLADDGLLDLDAPISDYLGEWGAYKTDITVAQLLSNSSGMPGLLDDAFYAPYTCMYLGSGTLAECAEQIYAADDAAERVPPDTEFHYGGGQWQLAGGIAEVVSGKSWDELINEIYLEPCGLENMGYANELSKSKFDADAGLFGISYPESFAGDLADIDPTDNPSIEGGAYTTIRDYAEILLIHLRGGMCGDTRVLSEAAVLRMQQDRIGEVYDGDTGLFPTMPGYGLGWWMSRTTSLVGDAGAYGATPWLDLDRRYGAMFLLEANATLGVLFQLEAMPLIEEILDTRGE